MTEAKNSEDGFYHDLQTLWSAESMLVEAMPMMIEKASSLGLKKSLAHHLAETDQHKVAIHAICKQFGIDPKGTPDTDIKTILDEGKKAMTQGTAGANLDAAIIAGAQKIEKYEIQKYTLAAQQAEVLGYEAIGKRLRLTLEEEQQAATKLNFLANHPTNPEAQKEVAFIE